MYIHTSCVRHIKNRKLSSGLFFVVQPFIASLIRLMIIHCNDHLSITRQLPASCCRAAGRPPTVASIKPNAASRMPVDTHTLSRWPPGLLAAAA